MGNRNHGIVPERVGDGLPESVDQKPFTDADGYAVADEILEYFDSYKIGSIAPIASIIRREREYARPKWQDMSTAPRDGTEFLALSSGGWRVLAKAPAGFRSDHRFQWWFTGGMGIFPMVETHGVESIGDGNHTLTKWMPLPEGEE